jgi:hypothetical protein
MSMSIFGNLDAQQLNEINDDPFFVKPDTYWAICTECVQKTSEDGSSTQCVITWTIDEPDNEYHKKNIQEYFSVYPEYSDWNQYSPDEKTRTKFFLRRLRRAFDLSESEINSVEYSELVGKGAYITLVQREGKEGTKNAGKKFVNVNEALSKRLYEEENESTNAAAASVGLL